MVRFDKPCVSVTHALNYFKMHMAGDDYLTEHGQAEMVWCGRDAARLGLHGIVQKDDFRKLCERKHPVTGETLSVRDSGPVRRVCYFGQISPPKDVSIAYLVGSDERIPCRSWPRHAVEYVGERPGYVRWRQPYRCQRPFRPLEIQWACGSRDWHTDTRWQATPHLWFSDRSLELARSERTRRVVREQTRHFHPRGDAAIGNPLALRLSPGHLPV